MIVDFLVECPPVVQDNCPQQKRILMFEQTFKDIDDVLWEDSGMQTVTVSPKYQVLR